MKNLVFYVVVAVISIAILVYVVDRKITTGNVVKTIIYSDIRNSTINKIFKLQFRLGWTDKGFDEEKYLPLPPEEAIRIESNLKRFPELEKLSKDDSLLSKDEVSEILFRVIHLMKAGDYIASEILIKSSENIFMAEIFAVSTVYNADDEITYFIRMSSYRKYYNEWNNSFDIETATNKTTMFEFHEKVWRHVY